MTEELENKWRMECLNPYNVDNPEAALSYYIYQAAYVTGRYDSQKELETTERLLDQANREIIGMVQIFSNQKQELETLQKENEQLKKGMCAMLTKNNKTINYLNKELGTTKKLLDESVSMLQSASEICKREDYIQFMIEINQFLAKLKTTNNGN